MAVYTPKDIRRRVGMRSQRLIKIERVLRRSVKPGQCVGSAIWISDSLEGNAEIRGPGETVQKIGGNKAAFQGRDKNIPIRRMFLEQSAKRFRFMALILLEQRSNFRSVGC